MRRTLKKNLYWVLIVLVLSIYQEECRATQDFVFIENVWKSQVDQESYEFQVYVRSCYLKWQSEGYECTFLSETSHLFPDSPIPASQENLYERFCRIASETTFGEYDYMRYSIVRWKTYRDYITYDLMVLTEEYFPDGPFGYVNVYSY